ncbi:MAG: hypothetical protein HZA60_01025 [Deltaproteobacteria bacterium]|nr:hypothetical protein [Deltaproteobacteria bacterium]
MPVFLAAAGTLAYEVLLTRVFSVVMWYHFASLAIAIAMFGLAVGGLLPYLLLRWRGAPGGPAELPPSAGVWFSSVSLLFSIAPYLVLLLLSRYPLWGGRLLEVFHQPYFEPFRAGAGHLPPGGDALQIGLLLLFFSLPFAGAGAVFAVAFSAQGKEGKTYLAVMGGSAAGVAAYLAAMRGGSGPAAFLFLSTLFSLSAAAFAARKGGVPVLGCFFIFLSALLFLAGVLESRYRFAEIRFVRGRYEPGILWARWDAVSRVAVYPVSDEESAKAWGMSPAYAGPVPEQIGMVVDDTGYTALFGTGKDRASTGAFRSNIAAAAYRLRGGGSALVIGPGGGKDILCALASGDFSVTAVEVNPLVVRAADGEFGDFTGQPYRMPRVRAVVAEGRNFLASDRNRYDVIQMTQVFGRIPPSAGAFTMTEDHLYTAEAFREYLSHLSDNGVISVTRFIYERRVWRILAMARDALRSLGYADPRRHILAFRDRGLINVLVRRTPWPDGEIAAAGRLSEEMRFPLVIAPDRSAAGLPAMILSGGEGDMSFDLSSPTDDRPFFYYTLPPKAFLSAAAMKANEFEDRAVAMLRGFLVSAAVMCALFLLAPAAVLARANLARPGSAATAYMFCVGVAYIVWEIVMIKQLALLFGTPLVAFAAGLTMVLAFSGLGGYLAGRDRTGGAGWGLALAAGLVSAYLYYAGPMLVRWAGTSPGFRLAVAAGFVLPPSVVMGRFFPTGLRRFGGDGGAVPFYFAANGAASVLGAALTQALTMNLGYRATTLFGAILYAGCALLLARTGRGRAGGA